MSRKPATAAAFLSALDLESPTAASPAAEPVPIAPRAKSSGRGSRAALKHIGGYLPDDAAERFARLKIRTKLGNDDLLALAINELWRIEGTKRKWDE